MARHRTARGKPYTSAEVLEAQAQVVLQFLGCNGMYPRGTLLHVHLGFHCVRHPWRGDADNLAKLVLDALRAHRLGKLRDGTQLEGAGVYADDRQIRSLHVEVYEASAPEAEGVTLHMHPVAVVQRDLGGAP